jgi:hypothetical protein
MNNRRLERARMLQEDLIEFRGNLIKARMDYGKDFKQVRQTAISSLRKEIQAVLGRDDLAQRVEVNQLIKSLEHDGSVYVQIWGRDCDMVESERVTKIPAGFYHYAEGPGSVCLISKEDAEDIGDGFYRDHIAEAFDNGNATSVCL